MIAEGNNSDFDAMEGCKTRGRTMLFKENDASAKSLVTKGLRDDDPKTFQMGTPQQVWMCMLRCWELCEPTSERIVEDIQGLVGVSEQIIENQGRVIPGDDLRKGHRAERHDGKGKLNSHLRNNQRKDSQYERPIHPDAQAAYDALVNFEDINSALFPDE